MEASVRVILSASVACEDANEAVVVENVRTVSMRARKSLVERVMYCGGYRAVGMGLEVCGEAEGSGACGTCHAPDPGPTRLANPNQFRGAKPYTETPYFFFLFFF